MSNANKRKEGVISRGIRTPVIVPGDDLKEIVISAVAEANAGQFDDGDIIAVTEAVVAVAYGNLVSYKEIAEDIARKFDGAKEIAIVDPIQSRNRFLKVLEAVMSTPTLEKVYIVMSYPTDEVGNRFVSDMAIMESGINPYCDVLSVEKFYSKLGEPEHQFTGKNYIEEYLNACEGKAEVILCNDFSKIYSETGCKDFLVCSVHRREETKKAIMKNDVDHIFDLSEIMNESINGSGFNDKFGLYGTNAMSDDVLKLLPLNCKEFVEDIQQEIYKRYGKKVEVMIYGDGCFKDPVGGIWELADPKSTLGATSGLAGTPKEVKLKYIASANAGKSPEEIESIVAEESRKRKETEEITGEASLGTTPRQITDLVASLADLTSGSGDRQTPVVYIKNYL